MKSVAIVIPLYKSKLSSNEDISIQQCFKILSNHEIIAIKPTQLELDCDYAFSKVISFDNAYFKDIAGYNRLMLSSEFYERFLDYQYILIYQPDAYVFKDELLRWCKMGYDYIGAPWLKYAPYPDIFKKIKSKITNYIHFKMNLKQPNSSIPTELQLENKVGNGGFSLRKTSKFYEICESHGELIRSYGKESHHHFNEDVFWSLEVNRKRRLLKIPNYKKAVFFAMENQLPHAFLLTKGKLPFGCHAWDRHPDYWKSIICR